MRDCPLLVQLRLEDLLASFDLDELELSRRLFIQPLEFLRALDVLLHVNIDFVLSH